MIRRSPYSKSCKGRLLAWWDKLVFRLSNKSRERALADNPVLACITEMVVHDLVENMGLPPSVLDAAEQLYEEMKRHEAAMEN